MKVYGFRPISFLQLLCPFWRRTGCIIIIWEKAFDQALITAVASDTEHRSTKPWNRPSVMPIMIRHPAGVTTQIDLGWLTDGRVRRKDLPLRGEIQCRPAHNRNSNCSSIVLLMKKEKSMHWYQRNGRTDSSSQTEFPLNLLPMAHLKPYI